MTAEQIHDALTLLPADLIAETDKRRMGTPKMIPWKRYAAMAACFVLVCCGGWLVSSQIGMGGSPLMMQEEAAMAAPESAEEPAAPKKAAAAIDAVPTEAAAGQNAPCALPTAPPQAEATVQDSNTNTSGSILSESLYPGISPPIYLEAIAAEGTACFTGNPQPKLFRSPAELDAYQNHTPKRFDLANLIDTCADYDETWFESHDLLLISICGVPAGEMPSVYEIRHYEGQWKFLTEDYSKPTESKRRDWHILLKTEKNLIADGEALILTTAISGPSLSSRRISTPYSEGYASHTGVPEELLICSRPELEAYFARNAACYDFAELKNACIPYDDSWFDNNDLLLIVIQNSHPDTAWEIVDITRGSRWDWEVLVSHHGIFYPGQEESSTHLLAELKKGTLLPEDNIIRVSESRNEA